jgi:Response regulator containing a CheY-like receiver domain and a GGDEF domain
MKKILIVEDDQPIALALSVRLKAYGYTTWIADDGIMAITMAVRNKPDLILLDVALPGGNGLTLIEQFHALPETCKTPIVLTTASHDPELRKKALALGVSGLLRKPYDAQELASVIHSTFGDPPNSEPKSAPESQKRHTESGQPMVKRILIVEDDQKIARGLAVRMKAAGFEPMVANDGVSGIRCAVDQRPDLVLLDVSLPAGDGFSVAESIQKSVPHRVPIIFLTASKFPELRSRARQLGAVGFFEKPYEAHALLAAVQHSLV